MCSLNAFNSYVAHRNPDNVKITRKLTLVGQVNGKTSIMENPKLLPLETAKDFLIERYRM